MLRYSLFLLLASMPLAACGDSDATGPDPDPVFTGAWQGAMPGTGGVRVLINHPVSSDGTFTGCVRVDIGTNGTFVGAPISGTLSGESVTMATPEGTGIVWSFTGTFSGVFANERLTGQATGSERTVDGEIVPFGSGAVTLTRSEHFWACTAQGF